MTEGTFHNPVRSYLGGLVGAYELPVVADMRGALLPLELSELPFAAVRVFCVHAPRGAVRGGHAHRQGNQILVRISGHIEVELRRAGLVESVTLDAPGAALLIPAGVWAQQTYCNDHAVLLVLADTPFDPSNYVLHT